MSDRLTTAGEALLDHELGDRAVPENDLYLSADEVRAAIRAIEAEAAARAVDEALSVERVAEAFHVATCMCHRGPGDYDHERAAALVAHLRGER